MGQGGGYAVQHALDVHVDHPVPLVDLEQLERRKRHEARIIDDDVDAAMRIHSAIDQRLHLGAVGHVGLSHGFPVDAEFVGQRHEPVQPPRAEHDFCASTGEMTPGLGAQPAARAAVHDDLVVDSVGHCLSLRSSAVRDHA